MKTTLIYLSFALISTILFCKENQPILEPSISDDSSSTSMDDKITQASLTKNNFPDSASKSEDESEKFNYEIYRYVNGKIEKTGVFGESGGGI